ncbi:MAG: heme-binding protein [Chitinophagaceae bacterium]|nr:heme-binding protein [Rubrivivax sp.]
MAAEHLTLDAASTIVDAALMKGRELRLAPLTVAVLDSGGHLVVLKREDASGLLRPDIAIGKAWGALGMGFGSRELERRATLMPQFFAALAALADGRMIPVAGGVLIRSATGRIAGAVGISGDTSDNDERCAMFGISHAGFSADNGGAAER